MLTGNLVLGADSAGTKELLKDGKFGVLYQCGNPESIKQQMLYILNHKEELQETAKTARDFMAEHMTAKKNAENIANFRRVKCQILFLRLWYSIIMNQK